MNNYLKSQSSSLLSLLALLLLYVLIILTFSSDNLIGDEMRYLRYAENLSQGFYTDVNNPDLSNGPGYPLVLLPVVLLGLPLIIAKLLNGIFVFIGIFFFYKTVLLITKKKYALIFALLLGLYPPLLRWMIFLYTESLTFMLISGFIFHFCMLYQRQNNGRKHSIWASFFLGFLVLTKVIFFQVMIFSALILGILFLTKTKKKAKRAFLVLAGAAVFISPYLVYAYLVTDKLFYLGTGGGEILYHRATPYENELGNWFSTDYILNPDEIDINSIPYQDLRQLSTNHRDFYQQMQSLTNMERDSAFKAKAIEYMRLHPLKYLKNTVSNTGRLLFHYPISYRSQNLNTYGYMLPNMFIVVLFILILYPAFMARRRIPFEIKSQLIFTVIYGLGMVLLNGKGRYFVIMVPSLLLFIAYVHTNILKITLAKTEEVK